MAQYNKDKEKYIDRNNDLFDVNLVGNELGEVLNKRYTQDAMGRSKIIADFSLFSTTWTFNVPVRRWEEELVDWTADGPVAEISAQPIVHSTSVDGMLQVSSGSTLKQGYSCRSKRHFRYQANRGLIFSTAVFVPNPENISRRIWGLATSLNGVWFEVEGDGTDWELYAVRVKAGAKVTREPLRQYLPADFTPENGHLYDIQYEWRGVGNYFFYIDQKLVFTIELLGTLTSLSINDPAGSVVYVSICYEEGTESMLYATCVDVSTEGGKIESNLVQSVNSGTSLITLGSANTPTATVAIQIPRNISYNGDMVYNSRGIVLDRLSTWTRDEAYTQIYLTRDYAAPNLMALTWTSIYDSYNKYLVGGSGTALQTAFNLDLANMKSLGGNWADIDIQNVITNASDSGDVTINPGDIVIVAITPITTNVKNYTSVLFSEQI